MNEDELSSLLQEWKRTPAPATLRERVFRSRRTVTARWWDGIPGSATALSGVAAGGLVAWGLIALASTQWRQVPPQVQKQEATPANVPASVQAVPEEKPRVKEIIPRRPRVPPRAPVVAVPPSDTPSVPKPLAVPRAASTKGTPAAGPLLIDGQPPNVAPEVVVLAAKKSVTLRIRIGKDGSVLEASVVDGDPILNDVAMEAVKTWRYQAYVLNGEPSEWTTDVVVNFGPKKTK